MSEDTKETSVKVAGISIRREIVAGVDPGEKDETVWALYTKSVNDEYYRFVDAQFCEQIQEWQDRWENVIAIYKEYYDLAEAIDRCYPHTPSPHSPTSVYPAPTWRWLRKQHHDKIRALIKIRIHKLKQVGLDTLSNEGDRRSAAQEGLRRHEAELKPCDCSSCERYR
jgi:hypothetical protein